MKSTIKIIIFLIVSIVVSRICSVGFVADNHFGLITVNTVLIGFMFTSISILLGFLEYRIVQLFEGAGALDKVYKNIEKGICYSVGSIGISILNLLIFERYIKSASLLNIIYSGEILLIIVTLGLLIKTLKDLKLIMESVHLEREKKVKQDKANKELDEILRNK